MQFRELAHTRRFLQTSILESINEALHGLPRTTSPEQVHDVSYLRKRPFFYPYYLWQSYKIDKLYSKEFSYVHRTLLQNSFGLCRCFFANAISNTFSLCFTTVPSLNYATIKDLIIKLNSAVSSVILFTLF